MFRATVRREIKNKKVTSSWFFLSTLNYDARSTTHQMIYLLNFNITYIIILATCFEYYESSSGINFQELEN